MVEFKVSNDSLKRHLKEDELFEVVMYLWQEQCSLDNTNSITIPLWCIWIRPLLLEGVYPERRITEILTTSREWFSSLDDDQQLLFRCLWDDSFPPS